MEINSESLVEKEKRENAEREKYDGHTVEQLTNYPRSEHLLKVYLEDKYVIRELNAEKMRELSKANGYHCPYDKLKKCMCEEFLLQDAEGVCPCKRFTKSIRDYEDFLNMRVATMSRVARGKE